MIKLDADDLRKIWPKASPAIIDAFCSVAGQSALEGAGINFTRGRLAYALAQVEHETGGWTIRDLTESLNYSADRMCVVWPSRFPNEAAATPFAHNERALGNKCYNGRMGNRPGTDDGFNYRGRGGPQVTGRDGYAEIQKRTGLPLLDHPELASRPEYQPAILAAFWSWKNLNAKADAGDFEGCTKIWNGGLVGYADRCHLLEGNQPYIERLVVVSRLERQADDLPGTPPTPAPPPEVIANATAGERAARVAAGAGAAIGGANQVAKTAQPAAMPGVEVPAPPPAIAPLPSHFGIPLLVVGLAAAIGLSIVIGRKAALVRARWR